MAITTFTVLLGQTLLFAIYAFWNPDVTKNEGAHCFVEAGFHFQPVAVGAYPSSTATDGTNLLLKAFLAEFVLSACLVCMVLVLVGLVIREQATEFDETFSGNFCCCVCFILVSTFTAITLVYVFVRTTRYTHAVRVCSGDYLQEQT